MDNLAIVILTPGGMELARRIADRLGRGEVIFARKNARKTLVELFQAGRPLVCVMALGIVVRILGRVARGKLIDPPVVVVDDAGRFAISVLGGHVAGANALAQWVAAAIGATPVITTACDVVGLPAVDLIGQEWGWKIERREHLTTLAAAVVWRETITVWQDAGRRDWWREFGEWPAHFVQADHCPAGHDGPLLLISDQAVPVSENATVVIYRPPTLVLGVGCRRGVPCEEIEAFFQHICRENGLSPLSLGLVATASLKADEPGLREFAGRHEVPLVSFGLDELARVSPLPTPSETVRAKIGVAGVAEPAALLAAKTDRLIVPKQRGKRVTMAVARRADA